MFMLCRVGTYVSIHAPYIGSDPMLIMSFDKSVVSIHAPYIGSDGAARQQMDLEQGFNPRSLHRERRSCRTSFLRITMFQSTLPT